MDLARLHQDVIETLVLLQSLNLTNLSLLGAFFQRSFNDTQLFRHLETIVRGATPSQLEALIIAATSGTAKGGGNGRGAISPPGEEDLMSLVMGSLEQQYPGQNSTEVESTTSINGAATYDLEVSAEEAFVNQFSEDQLDTIGIVYKLQQLQSMLVKSLSVPHLMKLFEIVPSSTSMALSMSSATSPETQQLHLLEQLQQLFANTLLEPLLSIQEHIAGAAFGEEQERISELLQLQWDQFHLCKPLKLLFQMDQEELASFHEALPKLQPLQLLMLVQLLQSDPYTVLEFRRILSTSTVPTEFVEYQEVSLSGSNRQQQQQPLSNTASASFEIATVKVEEEATQSDAPQPPVRVVIVEQPPEKSVYKRNLKPNPAVKLVGDESQIQGSLFVAPVLVRCDTQTDMPKLTGATPIKTTVGRLVPFKKLKVTITSHQENGALFCLRFEARRYYTQSDYEVIHSVQSIPMAVLSHSTQLKAPTSQPPSIQEVVPGSGTVNGGTKVAIIGSNFIDTPSARVRFDSTDVVPTFHSGGTLVCTTPQHAPATVTVVVSNDAIRWSDTSAKFTYEEGKNPQERQAGVNTVAKETDGKFHLPIDIARSVYEAAKEGGFNGIPMSGLNIDSHGYGLMHYAADLGHQEAIQQLIGEGANLNLKDKHGNSPLFYAVRKGRQDLIELLIGAGANINAQNIDGITPLHLAILMRHEAIGTYLLQHRAWPNLSTLEGSYTALHLAVAEQLSGLVGSLIKYGAYINEQDEDGDTPLHWAVRLGDAKIVRQLSEQCADIFIANEDSETPLDLAVALEEQAIAKFLFEKQQQQRAKQLPGTFPSEVVLQAAVAFDPSYCGTGFLGENIFAKDSYDEDEDEEDEEGTNALSGYYLGANAKRSTAHGASAAGIDFSGFAARFSAATPVAAM